MGNKKGPAFVADCSPPAINGDSIDAVRTNSDFTSDASTSLGKPSSASRIAISPATPSPSETAWFEGVFGLSSSMAPPREAVDSRS